MTSTQGHSRHIVFPLHHNYRLSRVFYRDEQQRRAFAGVELLGRIIKYASIETRHIL